MVASTIALLPQKDAAEPPSKNEKLEGKDQGPPPVMPARARKEPPEMDTLSASATEKVTCVVGRMVMGDVKVVEGW